MDKYNRSKLLLIAICAGLLLGIIFSHELWFPINRTFPRAALVFGLPKSFEVFFEWTLSLILVASLLLVIFSVRPKVFLLVAICSLLALAFFDQTRLQPWAYEYLLIFIVYLRHDWKNENQTARNQTVGLAQIVIAGIYVWSGIQKMNWNFAHEVLPELLVPVQNLFPAFQPPTTFLSIAIPLTEFSIGCGLFFRKTRNVAVCLAVLMHVFIVSLLIAKNYNSIVWFWNLTLIFADVFAFWKSGVSLREILKNERFSARKIIICAAVALPLLNFFGFWDSFLSGAYYAGNVEIPAIRINEQVFAKLPPVAKSVVFQTKTSGDRILPLFEWSIADTNAPVYLEQRVFEKCLKEVCKLQDNGSDAELIIRKRPSIIDGKYQTVRVGCRDIGK